MAQAVVEGLGGLTGELYRQFAVSISIAVSLSGVVALTNRDEVNLKIALTSKLLNPDLRSSSGLATGWTAPMPFCCAPPF